VETAGHSLCTPYGYSYQRGHVLNVSIPGLTPPGDRRARTRTEAARSPGPLRAPNSTALLGYVLYGRAVLGGLGYSARRLGQPSPVVPVIGS
jgi:hypothetical protein